LEVKNGSRMSVFGSSFSKKTPQRPAHGVGAPPGKTKFPVVSVSASSFVADQDYKGLCSCIIPTSRSSGTSSSGPSVNCLQTMIAEDQKSDDFQISVSTGGSLSTA
jgi:hypothetical protein